MKFNIGDKVIVNSTSDIGTITGFDGFWYSVEIADIVFGSLKVLYSETSLSQYTSKLKFNVGDKVVFNKTSMPSLIGKTGKILSLSVQNAQYNIELDTPILGFSTVYGDENELDLVNSYPQFLATAMSKVSFDTETRVPILDKYSHKCSFSTYIGLMYKEEFCDCGVTKNRRGIYE